MNASSHKLRIKNPLLSKLGINYIFLFSITVIDLLHYCYGCSVFFSCLFLWRFVIYFYVIFCLRYFIYKTTLFYL